MSLFDMGVATIFAREFLEAAIIIGNYRTVILKSKEWEGERQQEAFRAIKKATIYAVLLAIVVVLAVAIPLGVLSNELDGRVVEIIEGVSKVVAAICILQLSLKIPGWLGVYARKKGEVEVGVTLKEIRFNVSWNIWREAAECGVFLIPYFLGGNPKSIPISALVGIVIALILGAGIYVGNQRLESKVGLAAFMSILTGQLATGLFVGGCHEFEEVWGETPKVWKIQSDFWSHKKLPMVILKPFGYSASRTVLQIACFWGWTALTVGLHLWKIQKTKAIRAQEAIESDEKLKKDDEAQDTGSSSESDVETGEKA